MEYLRVISVNVFCIGFFVAPLFVSAQQIATSTAEQDQQMADSLQVKQSADAYQDSLNKLIEERTKLLLTPREIEKQTTSDYLETRINPTKPGPNELVTITLESYLSDLQKAVISWSLNGKIITQGTGRSSFSFQNGSSGATTRITATVTLNTGTVVTKNFSFTPIGVTIIWEADTYTPPFYRGKALITPQSQVRIMVIPDVINTTTSENFVYTWRQNDTTDENASGYGKNTYIFDAPKPLTNTNIRVIVSSIKDSKSESEMRINIPVARPFILFYEKHPLLGVWYNRPFDRELTLDKNEFSISAEPYFFSSEDATVPTLKYSWTINGSAIRNSGRNITLRNEKETMGDSLVSLAIRGIDKTFQNANQNLKIHFGIKEALNRPNF